MSAKPPEEFKVLVVDDDVEVREILVLNLEMNGYQIFQASGGFEAIDVVKSNKVDLVISDVRMPDGDGLQLLEKLREADPEIPVIFMVTGFSEYSEKEFIDKGANAFFNKPYDSNKLEQLVESYRKEV